MLLVAAVAGVVFAPVAAAEPIDVDVDSVVCQLVEQGWSRGRIAAELAVSFADFESEVVSAGGDAADWPAYVDGVAC